MTTTEFAAVIGYIGAACSKELPDIAMEAYYDMLGDLPLDVFKVAAKRVVLEHPWHTFPSVSELRQAASETKRGVAAEISPAEAWEMAWHAVSNMDLEMQHSIDKACKSLPPVVLEAMKAVGLPVLVSNKEPVGFLQARFLKFYEQLAARDRRTALLPDSLKRNIAEIGRKSLPPPNILEMPEIGRMDMPASSVACQPRSVAPIDFRTVAQKQTQVLEQEARAEDAAWDRCSPERKSELFARLASQYPGATLRPEMLDRPCRRLALDDERNAAKAAG